VTEKMPLPPLTPFALMTALATIPQGCTLVKNEVGNLAILDTDGVYIGFVDLTTGEVDLSWGDDDEDDASNRSVDVTPRLDWEPDPNLLPPKVLQLRDPEGKVLWEGPTPLMDLTGIVGTVDMVTDTDGNVFYVLPRKVVMNADETLTFGPASSGEMTVTVEYPDLP